MVIEGRIARTDIPAANQDYVKASNSSHTQADRKEVLENFAYFLVIKCQLTVIAHGLRVITDIMLHSLKFVTDYHPDQFRL